VGLTRRKHLIYSLGWNENSFVFDLNGSYLGEFPKRPLTMLYVTNAQFYHVNNDTYFKERSIDTIFKVSAESLIPHIIFETGNFSVPYEYKWWLPEKRKNVNFIFINKILENSNWTYVLIEKESIDYFALYNKSK
jgi:hypothetical protein